MEIPACPPAARSVLHLPGGGRQRRQHRYDAAGGLRCAQPEAQRHEPSRDTYVIQICRTVMINSVYSRGGGEEVAWRP